MIKLAYFVKLAAVTTSLCLVLIAPGWAQSLGETEKELLRIQDEWAAARVNRDVPYLERLYAREFRVHAMNGSVVSRQADIAAFASGDLKPDLVQDQDMEVSVYGDTAWRPVSRTWRARTRETTARWRFVSSMSSCAAKGAGNG